MLNPESIIFAEGQGDLTAPPQTACGQTLIGRSIEDIAVGKKTGWLKGKRRLIEMACVDGAVVFDDTHLLAVGALVRSHPSVGNQLGARTTAARSSFLWARGRSRSAPTATSPSTSKAATATRSATR